MMTETLEFCLLIKIYLDTSDLYIFHFCLDFAIFYLIKVTLGFRIPFYFVDKES